VAIPERVTRAKIPTLTPPENGSIVTHQLIGAQKLQGDLNRSLRPVGLGCPNLQKQLKRGRFSATGHAIAAWFLFCALVANNCSDTLICRGLL
jgi:hypothetical protein